ncbi:MAG: acyl-CoA dehydrogenase family protein [Solirubrobacteraceae bacterium]|nr:acyl-CoA dehydrogenase family protein [Solirubrobacteraceae bacterium]
MTTTSIAGELFGLPTTHTSLQAEARALAATFAPRAREIRQHFLDHGEMHPELWTAFCERGWPGLVISPGLGGTDGGLLGMTVVLEAFAAEGILLWMPVLGAAICHAIGQVGPEPVQERWLGRVTNGDTMLALAATEPECGHNLFRVKTEIRREGDHYVINGLKRVTSGLDAADRVLVFGRAPRTSDEEPAQFTAVLVDPRAAGATMTELPMRHREGVRQFQLELEDVVAPSDALVGVEGQGLLVLWPFTHVERVLTAALGVGQADYSVARSVERAKTRTISGSTPIGAEQAIQHPLANLYARLEAARLFLYRTAARFDAGVDGFVVAGEANMAKVLGADIAFDAADQAMQTMGADAWDEREGWIDCFLDARLARSGPVSNEFALNFIGQHVLGLPVHR